MSIIGHWGQKWEIAHRLFSMGLSVDDVVKAAGLRKVGVEKMERGFGK